jgi:MoxR-like ATPase
MMNKDEVNKAFTRFTDEVGKAVIGKDEVIQKVFSALLSNGHVLFEDVPGLGKTLLANSFARAAGLKMRRIQCTPDLLPGDITGTYVWDQGTSTFNLKKGPIFTNILLVDEINRASPKTQSALLEAMQERQVTIDGNTHKLPEPFIVLATQNPVEYEGTFPLPEAQLDRFLLRLRMGYPSVEEEISILESRSVRKKEEVDIQPVLDEKNIVSMRMGVEEVKIHKDIQDYIVRIIHQTRGDHRIAVGSSPRGALALQQLSKSRALLSGRTFVIPDDVQDFALEALSHRIILQPDYWMRKQADIEITKQVINQIEVPVIA